MVSCVTPNRPTDATRDANRAPTKEIPNDVSCKSAQSRRSQQSQATAGNRACAHGSTRLVSVFPGSRISASAPFRCSLVSLRSISVRPIRCSLVSTTLRRGCSSHRQRARATCCAAHARIVARYDAKLVRNVARSVVRSRFIDLQFRYRQGAQQQGCLTLPHHVRDSVRCVESDRTSARIATVRSIGHFRPHRQEIQNENTQLLATAPFQSMCSCAIARVRSVMRSMHSTAMSLAR